MKRLIIVLMLCVAMAACGGTEPAQEPGLTHLCQVVTDCGAEGMAHFCDGTASDGWDYKCLDSAYSAAGCGAVVDYADYWKDTTKATLSAPAKALSDAAQKCKRDSNN